MSQFCKETKEYIFFFKCRHLLARNVGNVREYHKTGCKKLASSNVTDSYAGLTVKMLNPSERQTLCLQWELQTWLTQLVLAPRQSGLPGQPCSPLHTHPPAEAQSHPFMHNGSHRVHS